MRADPTPRLRHLVVVVLLVVTSVLVGHAPIPGSSTPSAAAIDPCLTIGTFCLGGGSSSDPLEDVVLELVALGAPVERSSIPPSLPVATTVQLYIAGDVPGAGVRIGGGPGCTLGNTFTPYVWGYLIDLSVGSNGCTITGEANKDGVTKSRSVFIGGYTIPQVISWIDVWRAQITADQTPVVEIQSNAASEIFFSAEGPCTAELLGRDSSNVTSYRITPTGTGQCRLDATAWPAWPFEFSNQLTRFFQISATPVYLFWTPGYEPPASVRHPATFTIGATNALGSTYQYSVSGPCRAVADPADASRRIITTTGPGACGFGVDSGVVVTNDEGVFVPITISGSTDVGEPVDTTGPVITPNVTGTLGSNGWYTSDVGVSWTVTDAESDITSSTGCSATSVTADTSGVTFTCSASSLGGSSTRSVTITRDATPPTLAPTASPSSVEAGGVITATANAADATSGLASSDCDTPDTSAAGERSVTCTATDRAGNTASATARYSVTDTTGPEITPVVTGTQGTGGWYTSDVTVGWDVSDAQSAIATSTGCDATVVVADTSGVTFTCQAASAGGTSIRSVTIARDATPPTLAPTATPSTVFAGRTVTVAANAADALSGLASSGCDTPSTATAGTLSATCTATDRAGNTATAPARYTVIDRSRPTVTPVVTGPLGANGWYTGDVTVAWTVTDPESGITSSTGCDTTVVTTDSRDWRGTTFTCTAVSGGGRVSAQVTVRRDAAAPTLSPRTVPGQPVVGRRGAMFATASDALSGLATSGCTGFSTATLGSRSATCTATDRAGNTATLTVPYTVVFDWGGFRGVADAPRVNRVRAGAGVPIGFSLGGDQGLGVITSVGSAPATCPAPSRRDASPGTTRAATSALSYQRWGGLYTYTWATDRAWAGTCRQLTFVFADGSTRSLLFRFS